MSKRLTSILLSFTAVLLLCSSLFSCAKQDYTSANADTVTEFIPVVRFTVASDVHIDDKNSILEETRMARVFDMSYKYAEESDYYKALDAVLLVGDLTNSGTLSQMKSFKIILDSSIRDGTIPFLSLGNHDFYTNGDLAPSWFSDTLGVPTDEHIKINGFHFIRVSPSETNGYGEQKQEWLDKELADASADTPHLPIFVMQHHHISNTVYGSTLWGNQDLTEILEKYPQVVDFSGHSHFPIADPRSIWQDTFTAIGTGTLSYYEIGLNGVSPDSIFPSNAYGGWSLEKAEDTRDAAQFQIVEVDINGNIKLIGYDMLSNTQLFVKYINNPANCFNFVNNAIKAEQSTQPNFSNNQEISIDSVSSTEFELIIPQANGGETPIESYKIEIYHSDTLIKTEYALSGYIYYPITPIVRCFVSDLQPDTEYNLKIYAVNCYNKHSEPLRLTVSTNGL